MISPDGKLYNLMGKVEYDIPLSKLKVGDVVGCQKRYITTDGDYITIGVTLIVKRLNRKTVTLLHKEGNYTKCLPRLAAVCDYRSSRNGRKEEPLFGRKIA